MTDGIEERMQVIRDVEARMEAEAPRVETWTWERLAYPQHGPKTRRQRQAVTVRRHPSGWRSRNYPYSQQHSHTFGVEDATMRWYRQFHGEDHELHPVIWHVDVKVKGSTRPSWLGGWCCDAHLPDEFRPDAAHEDAPLPPKRDKRPPRPSYFATADTFTTTGVTKTHYWYRVQRGRHEGDIEPWPPQRSHFGSLYRSDLPEDLRERWGTADPELSAFKARYFAEVRAIRQAAEAAITERPEEHAAMFAALRACCCCCGRALSDDYSLAYGIGPECRAGLPPEVLTRVSERTARARGASAAPRAEVA